MSRLICACCGGISKGKQFWNQDTGYSICPRCFLHVERKEGTEYAIRCYGKPGVHHSIFDHNPRCEGEWCSKSASEVRKVPCGDGNLVLCHDCFQIHTDVQRERQHEANRAKTGVFIPLYDWDTLEIVPHGRVVNHAN